MSHRRDSEYQDDGDLVVRFKRTLLLILLGGGLAIGLITMGTCVAIIVRPPDTVSGLVKSLAVLAIFGGVGAYAIGAFIYKLITSPQLVLTNDAVLLRYGSVKVVGEVRYRNIASVKVVNRVEKNRGPFGMSPLRYSVLKIVLIEDDDEMTYWPGHTPDGNRDIAIEDEYQKDLSYLCKCIRERVHADQ